MYQLTITRSKHEGWSEDHRQSFELRIIDYDLRRYKAPITKEATKPPAGERFIIKPFHTIGAEEAQTILDVLYDAGYRPTKPDKTDRYTKSFEILLAWALDEDKNIRGSLSETVKEMLDTCIDTR